MKIFICVATSLLSTTTMERHLNANAKDKYRRATERRKSGQIEGGVWVARGIGVSGQKLYLWTPNYLGRGEGTSGGFQQITLFFTETSTKISTTHRASSSAATHYYHHYAVGGNGLKWFTTLSDSCFSNIFDQINKSGLQKCEQVNFKKYFERFFENIHTLSNLWGGNKHSSFSSTSNRRLEDGGQHDPAWPRHRRPPLHLRQAEAGTEAGKPSPSFSSTSSSSSFQIPTLLLIVLIALLDWADRDTW